jgi:hypothetical protein
LRPAWATLPDSISKRGKKKTDTQGILELREWLSDEHMFSMHKTLGSILSTTKGKRRILRKEKLK